MAPACTFGAGRCFNVRMALPCRCFRGGGRCLADCVRQRQEIIRARLRGCRRHRQSQHFPAARNGEAVGVLCAEVISMRLRIGGKRTQDSR